MGQGEAVDQDRAAGPSSELVVEARHAGLRADVYVAMQFPSLSRTRVKQKIMQGESLLNGRRYASSARLRPGDRLVMLWRADGPPDSRAAGAGPSPEILYEDAHLIAVNKPAGVAVHPTGRKQSATVIQLLRHREREHIRSSLAAGDTARYPSLVNRLDLFTSGAVLVAKDRVTLAAMHRMIAAGQVHKRYLALAEGRFVLPHGRIDLPLGPDPESPIGIKQAVREDGLPALTEYRVLESVGGYTLLEALPRTGRQHQLRAHLAAIGHPVWGDLIYADEALFLRYYANGCRLEEGLPPRQALHAAELRFVHPVEQRDVQILAPEPPDFLAIVEQVRAEEAERGRRGS